MTEVDRLLERFDSLITQFEKLVIAIGDKKWLDRSELQAAQQQYKSLKETLSETPKELQHRSMTDLERRFFFRELEKARTKLHARSNTNPINSNWIHQLADAQGDLTHGRFVLAEFKKKQN
jgi:hypothetical protein